MLATKAFRIFSVIFISLYMIDIVLQNNLLLDIEMAIDGVFSAIVFAIVYSSIKLFYREDFNGRVQSIVWLAVFALYQFIHIFHITDCNLYLFTNNLVNLSFLVSLRNCWIHHYDLSKESTYKKAEPYVKIINLVSGALLLGALPLILQAHDIATYLSGWINSVVFIIIIPFELFNITLVGYLIHENLKSRKMIIILGVQLLGILSYMLAPMISLHFEVVNILMIVSYILFFDQYFIDEANIKVKYELYEKNQFFSLFLDNPDIFLILQPNKDGAGYFIANLNKAAENKLGRELVLFNKKPERLLNMTGENFTEWISSCDDVLLNIQVNKEDRPFIADISKKNITIGDSLWILVNIRSVEDRIESTKKINIFEEVFKNAAEFMLVTDNNSKIIWANDEYVDFYGFTRDELIGNKPSIVKSGKHDEEFYGKLWSAVNTSGRWVGEIINKKKNNDLVTVMQSIVRIKAGLHNESYFISVASDLSEIKNYEKKLFDLAYISKQTSLFNRAYLEDVISDAEYDTFIAVYLNDLEYVKTALGERIGNVYINEIINRLRNHCKKEVFEFAPDVLVFFCRNEISDYTDLVKNINELSEHLKEKIEFEQELGLPDIGMIASFGEMRSVGNLILEMKKTMEYIKNSKQRGTIILNDELKKVIEYKFMFSQELKHALDKNEFNLVYQPIIDISERKIIGTEALIRWDSKTIGRVHPKDFIGFLEESELIHEVGYFVIERAISDYMSVIGLINKKILLSINVSPVQLTHKDFIQNINTVIKKHGIPTDRLVFEVVESQKFDKFTMVKENLKWLRTMGISIAIDDFGTEYSSLTRLSDLDVQYIKIDKAFFDNIHNSLSHALLVSGVIALAKNMNIAIIAEGIENYNQLLYLVTQNCKLVQGYYFEKPMSIEVLKTIMDKEYSPIIQKDTEEPVINHSQYDRRTEIEGNLVSNLELGLVEIDSNGFITQINKVMNYWLGGMSEIIVGSHLSDWMIMESISELGGITDKYNFEDLLEETVGFKQVDGSVTKLLVTAQTKLNRDNEKSQLLYFENINHIDSAKKYIVEKRASYKKVFQLTPMPILVWDLSYKIVDWNYEAEKLFGLSRQKEVTSLGQFLKNDGLVALRLYTDQLLIGAETYMENSLYDSMGNLHLCSWFSQPVYDDQNNIIKIISVIDDVTERKHAESEIKRLYHVLDQSEQYYLLLDSIGNILYANNQMVHMISNEFHSIKNINDIKIDFVNDDNTVQTIFDDQSEVWSGICRIYSDKIISLSCYREVFSGNVTEETIILLSLRDESQIIEHQREIELLKRKFTEQDRLAAIGQLSAGIAHEINNPLSYMLTNTNYLMKLVNIQEDLKTDFDDELKEIIQSYQEGLTHIKSIVSDLKSFVHSGSSEFESIQINDLIPKVINVAYNEIKYSSVVKLELEGALNEVLINKSKIQQVLLNLILNANHAIIDKYVNSMGEITIKTWNEVYGIVIEISDNGCGMDEETLSRIFEPFYTTKAEGIGSGLGLSISKEIVENMHKGYLKVSSEENVGTVFTIYLPSMLKD